MIVDYIDSHRESFGVEPICAVLAEAGIVIAPSTYYARRQARLTDAEMDDAYLANQLRSLWQDNWGVYGARKLWHAARRAGHDLGRDQVARLMRLAGIAGTVRGRHRTMTTQRDQTAPRHPDLVKRGWHAPTGLDQLWVADFSYVWTLAGFVYVAFVVDVFSRRILGWRVTTTKHTGMVTDALRQALQVRRRAQDAWVAPGLRSTRHPPAAGGHRCRSSW
jgi:putative transposase